MGVRDRHNENILVQKDTGTLFHIDFGYMLGEKVSVDTGLIAITKDLQKTMGKRWPDFVSIATKAWLILRQNSQELIDYARLSFSFIYDSNSVENYLRDILKIDEDDKNAFNFIENEISKAPNLVQTKLKNVLHNVAQKIKQ